MNTPEEVRAFFKSHWTVRKYKTEKIPAEHLDVILEAAHRAPTDATAQMYSFIHLTDDDVRKEVARLSNNPHMAVASETFVICADIYRLEQILKLRAYEFGYFPYTALHFAIGDAVLAGQSMLIAAEMLGHRGCWIGGIISALDEIAKLLKLPDGVVPFAGLTIGVPDETPQYRPRIDRNLMIHKNSYRKYSADELSKAIDDMKSITHRGDWALTLNGYFGKGGSMEARDVLMAEFLKRGIFKRGTMP